MVRRCFVRVGLGDDEARLDLLCSGRVQLSFRGAQQTFDTLEEALDGAAWWSELPSGLYHALASELELMAHWPQ